MSHSENNFPAATEKKDSMTATITSSNGDASGTP